MLVQVLRRHSWTPAQDSLEGKSECHNFACKELSTKSGVDNLCSDKANMHNNARSRRSSACEPNLACSIFRRRSRCFSISLSRTCGPKVLSCGQAEAPPITNVTAAEIHKIVSRWLCERHYDISGKDSINIICLFTVIHKTKENFRSFVLNDSPNQM